MKIETTLNENSFHLSLKYDSYVGKFSTEAVEDTLRVHGINVVSLFCIAVENYKIGVEKFVFSVQRQREDEVSYVVSCQTQVVEGQIKLNIKKEMR